MQIYDVQKILQNSVVKMYYKLEGQINYINLEHRRPFFKGKQFTFEDGPARIGMSGPLTHLPTQAKFAVDKKFCEKNSFSL